MHLTRLQIYRRCFSRNYKIKRVSPFSCKISVSSGIQMWIIDGLWLNLEVLSLNYKRDWFFKQVNLNMNGWSSLFNRDAIVAMHLLLGKRQHCIVGFIWEMRRARFSVQNINTNCGLFSAKKLKKKKFKDLKRLKVFFSWHGFSSCQMQKQNHFFCIFLFEEPYSY